MAHEDGRFSVGQVVRVVLGGETRRGTISIVHDVHNGPFDILYEAGHMEDGSDREDEEEEVSKERVKQLESFETKQTEWDKESKLQEIIDKCWARSRRLARLKDYRAACSVLVDAQRILADKFSVGAVAVIYSGELVNDVLPLTKIGIVGTIDNQVVDMMCDTEDVEVPQAQVFVCPSTIDKAILYVEVSMQIVKFSLQMHKPNLKLALQNCCVPLRICESILSGEDHIAMDSGEFEIEKVRELCFQFHMLQTRAHIVQQKLKAASISIRKAVLLKPSDKKARDMVRIVKQRKAYEEKQNKILARNVTLWVDKAMRDHAATNSENCPGVGSNENNTQNHDEDEDSSGVVGW
eukprot:CAMPEP_0203751238 /NCGR_PEP_ID=MMETSP0098-20131031/5343_1 /ASSEMBLY_ACC=CAM_ASM_000208 /TAXON_ID=96639 /ORGANISM=" , Strain NY0313808BC1" /LENGTH=350 /DNA_ID=CAMNT_0050640863 /DNA_START=109 /DNA_END=1158 /DNA_ORIENTATION=+